MTTIDAARPGLTTTSRLALSTDAELARLLVRGDHAAFAAIYARHFGLVLRIAQRYVADQSHAEDVAQEAFSTLWLHRHRYRAERGALRGWLAAITRHRAIDAVRRRRSRPRIVGSLDEPFAAPARDDVPAEVERREICQRTRAAIARLPVRQREVIGLISYAGLSHAEIAQHTGAPLGTVKSRARLGMKRLRIELLA